MCYTINTIHIHIKILPFKKKYFQILKTPEIDVALSTNTPHLVVSISLNNYYFHFSFLTVAVFLFNYLQRSQNIPL